jgi:hypothetical protein
VARVSNTEYGPVTLSAGGRGVLTAFLGLVAGFVALRVAGASTAVALLGGAAVGLALALASAVVRGRR